MYKKIINFKLNDVESLSVIEEDEVYEVAIATFAEIDDEIIHSANVLYRTSKNKTAVNERCQKLSKLYSELSEVTGECARKNCGSCETEAGCDIAARWSDIKEEIKEVL